MSWARESAPNQSYAGVLSILNTCPAHDEGICVAHLVDIKPDANYS